MSDNGGQKPEKNIKTKPLLIISIGEDNKIYVAGDIANKSVCLNALAETIRLVTNYQPAIIAPQRHSILNFARNFKRGG